MNVRTLNWPLWWGFLLTLVAGFSFLLVFVSFPVTRDFPWVNLLLFLVAAIFLWKGIRRGFARDRAHPIASKIITSILATVAIAFIALFLVSYFVVARQLPPSTGAPHVGQKLPEFTLSDSNSRQVSLNELMTAPINGQQPKGVLLVFYRGYWWPLCNSELRGIEKSLPSFNQAGIRPVAISVDTPEESRNLMQKAGYSFTFLSDPNAELIRRYDLLHAGAGENGRDIARPAEFLVDRTGTVRWVNLTENYFVRARPETILEQAKLLQ